MKKPIRARFRARDLENIGEAYPWVTPPLIGDVVTLNSGGPRMLVVDIAYPDETVTTSWQYEEDMAEMEVSYRCLRPWTEADL